MTRKELVSSPEYWVTGAQIDLFRCACKFMEEHEMNRKQLAEYLGVSKSYVTQLLNGDFDHRLSKFAELAISFGYVPKIDLVELDTFIEQDVAEQIKWNNAIYKKKTEYISIDQHTYYNSKTENNEVKEVA